jgi:hypothetical protein
MPATVAALFLFDWEHVEECNAQAVALPSCEAL